MTAIRWGGEVITYRSLCDRMHAYEAVVSRAGLSERAGLSAALMSLLPERARSLGAVGKAEWVADALAWLGRGAADSTARLPAAG